MARRRADRVGVRELRQNLSVYLRRIREDGASYEVTDHGEPVARLTPLADDALVGWDRLVADGRVTPASRAWEALPPPRALRGRALSEVLKELRDEEPD
jgi:prevent-host-death family protein